MSYEVGSGEPVGDDEYVRSRGYINTHPLGLECDVPIIPDRREVNSEPKDTYEPIRDMLVLTNLAARLGIPQPADLCLEWDDPEYLLWILWRCDSIAPRS